MTPCRTLLEHPQFGGMLSQTLPGHSDPKGAKAPGAGRRDREPGVSLFFKDGAVDVVILYPISLVGVEIDLLVIAGHCCFLESSPFLLLLFFEDDGCEARGNKA